MNDLTNHIDGNKIIENSNIRNFFKKLLFKEKFLLLGLFCQSPPPNEVDAMLRQYGLSGFIFLIISGL